LFFSGKGRESEMKTRQLGKSELEITPIGLGAWAMGGGGYAAGWGPQNDEESIQTIHRAIDLGINWIDTAPVYGLGRSEEVVGRALKGRAERPYVFTKCSLVWDARGNISNSLQAESIRRECEASLRRLQIDAIDLYQIHWPNPDPDIEEAWGAMAQLKREGKVRYIGVSNFDVAQMKRAMAIAPITSLQPPYSLLNREIETEILPFCIDHDIGVIVYSPMASGLLTGAMSRERIANLPADDWRRSNAEYQEPRLTRNLELVQFLTDIGFPHQMSPGEVAIAWTLGHPGVTGAIVGARRPDQISNLINAAEFRLDERETEEIDQYLRQHP
jgi:aryl-alcohol dehydrogenase-like predicted oxidoreductase